MRIIGGTLKGRSFMPPKTFNARPTTDFAKEGLFNMLENAFDFSQLNVLDLFGGSGGISLEFVSRGCPQVTCVEMNADHARAIRRTAAAFDIDNRLRVVHHNVFDFLPLCRVSYNLIFADPPYDIAQLDGIPQKIFDAGVLTPGGTFILEHPSAYSFAKHPYFVKEKKYSTVHFSIFFLQN